MDLGAILHRELSTLTEDGSNAISPPRRHRLGGDRLQRRATGDALVGDDGEIAHLAVEPVIGDRSGVIAHPPIAPVPAGDGQPVILRCPAGHRADNLLAHMTVGVGDDDVIARVYLPGDAMKRLHWKATAHRGELMVRQEEQQINPRAGVFLDCEPRTQGTARDSKRLWEYSPTFEWGIVAAASIVHHLARNGYVVAFKTSSPAIDREIADG